MAGRDHTGAGKFGPERQRVGGKTHQIVDKQKQPSYARGELTRGKYEVADIGDGLGIGADPLGAFLVEPTWQWREPLVGQNLAHCGGAQRRSLLLERLTDLVDRIVALAQRHDLLHGPALLGCPRGPVRPVAKSSGNCLWRKAWHSTRKAPGE